ncbi:MAG: hypothetical protein EZS28_053428, partial [Streblomastix strix]
MELGDNEVGGKSAQQEEQRNESTNQKMDIDGNVRGEQEDSGSGIVTRRTELHEITNGRCISTLPSNQLDEISRIETRRMDGEVQDHEQDIGRLEMVGRAGEEQFSEMFCQTHTKVDADDGCIRERMGSDAGINRGTGGSTVCVGRMVRDLAPEEFQLKGTECSTNGNEKVQRDTEGSESIADQDRQYSNGIQREKMERQGGSAAIDEEAEDASNGIGVDNLNGAHSGAAEHNNRHLDYDGDQRGLQ